MRSISGFKGLMEPDADITGFADAAVKLHSIDVDGAYGDTRSAG